MKKSIGNTIKSVMKGVEWVIFAVLLFLILIVLSPYLPTKQYVMSYIVPSASMEPTIHTGSVAFVTKVKPEAIKPQDIITFTSPQDSNQIILHRVIEIKNDNGLVYKTKGDNNNVGDSWDVPAVSLQGKYVASLPLIGQIAAFMQTPKGFILLFVIPALFLIIFQIKMIKEGIHDEVKKRVEKELQKRETTKLTLIIFTFLSLPFLFITLKTAQALFVTQVSVNNVSISVKDFVPPEAPTNLHWDNPSVACGGVTNSYTITADWNDSFDVGGSGINHYEYNILYPRTDGTTGDWKTNVITSQYSGVFNAVNGLRQYRVRAVDNAGNISAWSNWCSISYDNQAPTVSIGSGNAGANGTRQTSIGLPEPIVNTPSNTSPIHGGAVSGTIPVYGSADDPHMMRYHFRVIKDGETESGKDWTAGNGYNKGGYAFTTVVNANLGVNTQLDFDPVTPGIQDFDTTLLANGSYWLIIGARDTLGQRNAADANRDPRIKIVIDNALPIISNVQYLIATPDSANEPTAMVSWNTDKDATSNLDWKTSLSDPWTPLLEDTDADRTNHIREIEGLLPETTYYFRVRSKDVGGNEAISTTYSFQTGSARLSIDWGSKIVLNEFLPNPTGDDDVLMPGGEWVELYNRGTTPVDVSGWYVKDAAIGGHKLFITTTNSVTSNPTTSGLLMAPGEFLVVYRNGGTFSLNDDFWGGIVILARASGWLMDEHIYTGLLGDDILENKSFARFPDGSATWFDPIPSPGGPNILEENVAQVLGITESIPKPTTTQTPTLLLVSEPILSLSVDEKTHTVSFALQGVALFKKLTFTLSYDTDTEQQGIVGMATLNGTNEFTKEGLFLGTCSTGGTCTYHTGVKNLNLTVTLKDKDGKETVVEKSL